jgi:hypothetical protein
MILSIEYQRLRWRYMVKGEKGVSSVGYFPSLKSGTTKLVVLKKEELACVYQSQDGCEIHPIMTAQWLLGYQRRYPDGIHSLRHPAE